MPKQEREPIPEPPLSFADLLSLEKIDEQPNNKKDNADDGDEPERVEKFRSLKTPTSPFPGIPRVFGGFIYAQSAYAASKTVPKGFLIHVCL